MQGNVISLTVVIRLTTGQGGKCAGYRKLGYQAVRMDQPQDRLTNEKQYVAYRINNNDNKFSFYVPT
jgi:hypothetical protein